MESSRPSTSSPHQTYHHQIVTPSIHPRNTAQPTGHHHERSPTIENSGIVKSSSSASGLTRANRPRKRASNACRRCRSQKIKCNGAKPCEQCVKRKASCVYDDRRIVSQSFIRDLERRVAAFERGEGGSDVGNVRKGRFGREESDQEDEGEEGEQGRDSEGKERARSESRERMNRQGSERLGGDGSRSHSPTPKLMNPLGLDHSTFALDAQGRPIYLGTSSTWSFGRRVLAMAHEQVLKAPLPSERLHWEGEVYDLDFQKDLAASPLPVPIDAATLPQADFAIYLINTVKFYCGQMFHLFDEDSFMRQFAQFHDGTSPDRASVPQLWQAHYLLILAFGKAFVSRNSTGRHPPGWEMFLKGMQLQPNITFVTTDPLETMEFFCCAGLYLHSLDFRCSAYRVIGQALRLALAHGLHTSMESQHIGDAMLQRCRKIWWTIFVLDRQMTALMGVPLAMRDADITSELPVFPGSPQKSVALDLHVKLSKVVAKIVYSVYGAKGRLNESFVVSTKAALKNIAQVTEELNTHFHLNISETSVGMSRLAAYLHLLNHQCVVLATRPLFFSMLEVKLSGQSSSLLRLRNSRSVRWLAQMCVESAQQMLRIVGALQEQSLLESFLPFDLDSVFMGTMILIIANSLDHTLFPSQSAWIHNAYCLLDEIRLRGNLRAGYQKAELLQLDDILSSIAPSSEPPLDIGPDDGAVDIQSTGTLDAACNLVSLAGQGQGGGAMMGAPPPFGEALDLEPFMWQDGISTEQLMMVADTLEGSFEVLF